LVFSGRLNWSALLLALLLVTPSLLPAPPGPFRGRTEDSAAGYSSSGISTANAFLIGQLLVDNALVDLQWGQTVSGAAAVCLQARQLTYIEDIGKVEDAAEQYHLSCAA
jgi:hypothetical protein